MAIPLFNADGSIYLQAANNLSEITNQAAARANIGVTGGAASWVSKTGAYTAASGDQILADTNAGIFTINLPASPLVNNSVIIADSKSTWGTNNLTIDRNGATIRGLSEDLVCNASGYMLQLLYNGSTWDVFIFSAQSVQNTMPSGTTIQRQQASVTAYSAVTSIIPLDDTIPQSSEGTQLLSQGISLASASNKVNVSVSLPLMAAAAAGTWIIVSVFRDTTYINGASFCVPANNYGTSIAFEFDDSPGVSSPTYSVRVGPGAAGTVYVNGTAGARMFGGGLQATLKLEETKA